jgi:hypothetical protein
LLFYLTFALLLIGNLWEMVAVQAVQAVQAVEVTSLLGV